MRSGTPGRTEDDAHTARELGEDRHSDRPDEQLDRLRENPVARAEQEPGEDYRQDP
jgi:hypothetical protein